MLLNLAGAFPGLQPLQRPGANRLVFQHWTNFRPLSEMKIEDVISSLRDRIRPPRGSKVGNALKVAAGTAAAVWVVLQLRRELYGPGGSRLSRYDPAVDKRRGRGTGVDADSETTARTE